MNLVSAAPEVERDGRDVPAITGHLGELPVHIIAHPDREHEMHNERHDQHRDEDPEPGPPRDFLHAELLHLLPHNVLLTRAGCLFWSRAGSIDDVR
jgi:hypothetical protein